MLYHQVLEVAKKHMGQAAQAFIDRQITDHMKIKPEDLAPSHLAALAHWCYISAKLNLQDAQKAKNFENDLLKLNPRP